MREYADNFILLTATTAALTFSLTGCGGGGGGGLHCTANTVKSTVDMPLFIITF